MLKTTICALLLAGAATGAQAAGLRWVGLWVQNEATFGWNFGGKKSDYRPEVVDMSIDMLQNDQIKMCYTYRDPKKNNCHVTNYTQKDGIYSLGTNNLGYYRIRLVNGGLSGEWRMDQKGQVMGFFILRDAP